MSINIKQLFGGFHDYQNMVKVFEKSLYNLSLSFTKIIWIEKLFVLTQYFHKFNKGSYTNHELVVKIQLSASDQMPENYDKNFYVEFTQPATTVSHTVLRSVSILGGSGEPPEKFVKYLARHEYKLEIDFAEKEVSAYKAVVKRAPEPEPEPKGDDYFPEERPPDSDSDSD